MPPYNDIQLSRPCPLGLPLQTHAPQCDKKCAHDKNLRACGPIFYKEDPWPHFHAAWRSGELQRRGFISPGAPGRGGDGKFQDPGFNLNAHDADFGNSRKPSPKNEQDLQGKYRWRRPFVQPQVHPGAQEEVLFGIDGVGAGDIRQGQLGDCWLLGSIAAVAGRFPNCIRRCLRWDPAVGVLSFRFRSPDDGKPRWLLLDDQIPVYNHNERDFVFCSSAERNELWPVFLEKGFAKWMGGYMNCRGGVQNVIISCCEPMQALSFATRSKTYYGDLEMGLWKELLEIEDSGWLVKAAAKTTKGHLRDPITGLVGDHQFSVLDMIEVRLDKNKDFVSGFLPWLESGQAASEVLAEERESPRNICIHNETGNTVNIELRVTFENGNGSSSMNLTLQGVHTFYCWALPPETWSRGEFRWDCPPGSCHIFSTPTSVAYKWGDAIYLRSDGSTDVQDAARKLEADVRQEAAAVRKSAALQYWTRVSGYKDHKGALLRLVKLRNPWGHGEWTGLWSDKSLAWRYFPGVTKKVFGGSEKPVVADDGTFFMQWADFVKYFKDVIACGGYMDADSIPDAPDADHWATIQNGNGYGTTATQRKKKREQGGAGAGGGAAVGGPATTNSHIRGGGAGAPGEHRSTGAQTRTTAVEAESEDSSDEDFSDDDDDFDWDAEDSDIDFSEEDHDEEDTDEDEDDDGELAEDADGSEGVVLGKRGVFAYPERPAAELLPGGSSCAPRNKTFRAPTTLEIFEGGQTQMDDEVGRSPPPNELQQGLTFALYCRFPYTEKMFACQKQQFHLAGIGCQGPCIVHRDITLLAETDSDGNPYCTVRLGSGGGGGSGRSSCITFREDWPFWFDDWLWLAVTYGEGENHEDDAEGDRHVRVYVEGSLVMEKHWYHAEGAEDGLDFAVSDFPDAITLGATEGDTIEDPENSWSYVGFEAQGVAVWGRCLTEDEICVLEKRVSGKIMKVENVSLAVGAPVVVMGGAGGRKGDQGVVVENKYGDGPKVGAARVAPESQAQGATKSKRSTLCGCLK